MKTLQFIFFILIISLGCFSQTKNAKKPSGMFLMADAKCAGMRFNNDDSITFINEIACMPWELRAQWLDNKTFITVEKEKVQENCPPRVDVYKIISFDGKNLKLKSYSTGWGKQTEEIIRLKKK